MEKSDQQRRLREPARKYSTPIEETVETDLAEELARQKKEEQRSTGKSGLEQMTLANKINSSLETKTQEPSALYVAAAVGADICKSAARVPLDYLVGLLPGDVQKKLYEERSVRATKTNCLLQPLVTGSIIYFLMQNQTPSDQILWTYLGVIVEVGINVFRWPGLLSTQKDKTAGHPLLTAPYHLFRISAQFATQTVPKYFSNAYSQKKQEIISKRK